MVVEVDLLRLLEPRGQSPMRVQRKVLVLPKCLDQHVFMVSGSCVGTHLGVPGDSRCVPLLDIFLDRIDKL